VILTTLTILVALQHIAFGVLEMFFWHRPLGRKIFRTQEAFALQSKALAANQGLYNLFLAAALFWSFAVASAETQWHFQLFGFSAVVIAGIFGALTVNRRILWIQCPIAALGLLFLFLP
jgi:putative membrane protein